MWRRGPPGPSKQYRQQHCWHFVVSLADIISFRIMNYPLRPSSETSFYSWHQLLTAKNYLMLNCVAHYSKLYIYIKFIHKLLSSFTESHMRWSLYLGTSVHLLMELCSSRGKIITVLPQHSAQHASLWGISVGICQEMQQWWVMLTLRNLISFVRATIPNILPFLK